MYLKLILILFLLPSNYVITARKATSLRNSLFYFIGHHRTVIFHNIVRTLDMKREIQYTKRLSWTKWLEFVSTFFVSHHRGAPIPFSGLTRQFLMLLMDSVTTNVTSHRW